jgi:CRP/FNR family transcriptional regulator
MDKIAYFKKADLFHGLSEAELKQCERDLPMFRAKQGRLLFRPGGSDEALFVIKEGAVRIYRLSPHGREITLGTLDEGNVFGTLPMFGGASRNTFAQAATDAVICKISEPLLHLIRRHPQVGVRLLRVVGERLAALEDLTEDLVFKTAEQRVAKSVLRMVGDGSPEVSVSHDEIAKTAGVARETVTKVLDRMRRRGWVRLGYRSVKVVDRRRVEERAEE